MGQNHAAATEAVDEEEAALPEGVGENNPCFYAVNITIKPNMRRGVLKEYSSHTSDQTTTRCA